MFLLLKTLGLFGLCIFSSTSQIAFAIILVLVVIMLFSSHSFCGLINFFEKSTYRLVILTGQVPLPVFLNSTT